MAKQKRLLVLGAAMSVSGGAMILLSDPVRFAGIFVLTTGVTCFLAAWLKARGLGGGV